MAAARNDASLDSDPRNGRSGIKTFTLAESSSGYLLNSKVYSGKEGNAVQKDLGRRAVMSVIEPFLDKGCYVFMDNFYTSVALFKELEERKTLACGTVRSNRSGLPREICGAKERKVKQLKSRDSLSRQKGNVTCVTWRDRKPVSVLATTPTSETDHSIVQQWELGKEGLRSARMDDSEGTYKFPRYFKSEYHGGFKDGMFHGEGQIKFPELGVSYSGKFEKGKAIEGYLEFTDGLRYDLDNHWTYCDGDQNRAFKCELENGLKPAGRSQLSNQQPPQPIPEGMFDCGDGFYDPKKRTVIDYDHAFLRNTDEREHNWIVNRCRKAWDEPVGKRKIH